jgi:hypothetical protein
MAEPNLKGGGDRAVTSRLPLVFLALTPPLMLVLSFVRTSAGEWLFASMVAAFPVALIAFALRGRRWPGVMVVVLALLLVVLEASTLGMLLLRDGVWDAPWFGGLPAAAAIQLYGLFLVPLVPVALLYALTFDRLGLQQHDIDRLARHGERSDPGR